MCVLPLVRRYVQHAFVAAESQDQTTETEGPGFALARGWATANNNIRYPTIAELVLHPNGHVTGLHVDSMDAESMRSSFISLKDEQEVHVVTDGSWDSEGGRLSYTLQHGLMLYRYQGCIHHTDVGGKWDNYWFSTLPEERTSAEQVRPGGGCLYRLQHNCIAAAVMCH